MVMAFCFGIANLNEVHLHMDCVVFWESNRLIPISDFLGLQIASLEPTGSFLYT